MEDEEYEDVLVISYTDHGSSILPQSTAEKIMKMLRLEATESSCSSTFDGFLDECSDDSEEKDRNTFISFFNKRKRGKLVRRLLQQRLSCEKNPNSPWHVIHFISRLPYRKHFSLETATNPTIVEGSSSSLIAR